MFYSKRKSYRGRWLVKLLQATLVLGVVFFGLDALGQWLQVNEPVSDEGLVLIQPEVINEEITIRPIIEEARNSDANLDAEDYFYLALDHQNAYDYYEAIVDYTRAIELDSSIASSWLNRGVAYEQLGESGRALADFNQYLIRNDIVIYTQATVEENASFTIEMYEGLRYDFPMELRAGQVLNIQVTSVEEDLVDPIILIVDANGNAVAGNDDVLRQDGTFISMNAYIHSFDVADNGTYTLYVSHAGGGSYGAVDVKISIDN